MRTNFSQEVQPIILTEPQIQNDHTGMRLLKMAVQLVSAGCRLGRDIVLLQIAGHHLSQRGVIIDNNDMADICEHELISQPPQSPAKLWCLRRRTRPRGRFATRSASALPEGLLLAPRRGSSLSAAARLPSTKRRLVR